MAFLDIDTISTASLEVKDSLELSANSRITVGGIHVELPVIGVPSLEIINLRTEIDDLHRIIDPLHDEINDIKQENTVLMERMEKLEKMLSI